MRKSLFGGIIRNPRKDRTTGTGPTAGSKKKPLKKELPSKGEDSGPRAQYAMSEWLRGPLAQIGLSLVNCTSFDNQCQSCTDTNDCYYCTSNAKCVEKNSDVLATHTTHSLTYSLTYSPTHSPTHLLATHTLLAFSLVFTYALVLL